jgi:RNA polymerase primary sigma factor
MQPLFSWQEEALAAWERAGRRGMVEAVTGSGKTHVGIGALAKLCIEDKRLSPLVVVPSIALMEQWCERLKAAFPGRQVGLIGGGHRDDFSILPLACVAVVNSAVLKVDQLLAHCRRGAKNKSFLIADECHHYIDAPVFGRIRQFPFDYTLGLSATLFPFEVPGLGKIVYEYKFGDACKDGIVPPFDLVNIAISLSRGERDKYLKLNDAISRQTQLVMNLFGRELENAPDQFFFNRLRQLMALPGGGEDPTIKRLFDLLFKRAEIVYTAAGKMRLAEQMTRMLVDQGRKKLVVFFERIQSADGVGEDVARRTAARLHKSLQGGDPIWCRVYHSQLRGDERARGLAEFRRVGPSALLACRGLDEGIDIPQVDAAILAASTQSKRQRIQRIGRTLRRGNGNKRPLVITLFAQGTNDENVTAEDRATFAGVATIHDETEQTCLKKVRELM